MNDGLLDLDDLKTLLGRKVQTSVLVHGLLIPANSLQSRLHHFGQNLIQLTHDPDCPVRLIGSATGLEYKGQQILVATAHQTKGVPSRDIGVLNLAEQNWISSAGHTEYTSPSADKGDKHDLALFDYTDQCSKKVDVKRRFYRMGDGDALKATDEVLGYLAYGCPFSDQTYDIFENNHVGTVIRSMTCEPLPQPADASLGACKTMSEINFDANGLSGGPVFATVFERNEVHLKFAGVINRAGAGTIHLIRAQFVQRLMDLALSAP